MSTIFEGSEKKLELVVREGISLLDWPEERFKALVHAANTQILSKIENPNCRAFLLSESSLFVWHDRFTMITCGTTTLAEAAVKIFDFITPSDIDALIYERKNEYFPHLQKSSFHADAKKLDQVLKGRAYRMGDMDEHHLYLFHSDRKFRPTTDDTTLEILMYGIQGDAKEIFNRPGQSAATIRKATRIDRILPGFTVDDYAFEPIGYSLNAINGPLYYTVHVTPQESSSYVSFETNMVSRADLMKTIQSVLEVFRPTSFDLVYFDTQNESERLEVPSYYRLSLVREKLRCGYTVSYGHFAHQALGESRARTIDIDAEG